MDDDSMPPRLSFVCPERWESMRAAGPQRRFCDQCQLHVHDLSAMSSQEAASVLAGTRDRVCVSYLVRPDGTMVTHRRWNVSGEPWAAILRRSVLALLAMVAPFWFAACTNDKTDCHRLGGSTIVGGDSKDSPPAAAPRLGNDRLTGRTGHP